MKDWRRPLELLLMVTEGHQGIFPDVALLCWLRSVAGRAQLLVVRPRPPDSLSAGPRQRSFSAVEKVVAAEEVDHLTALLDELGYPGRPLRVSGVGDPDLSWWSRVDLEVRIGNEADRVLLPGPGFVGEDAGKLESLLRQLLEIAGAFDDRAWRLITGNTTAP